MDTEELPTSTSGINCMLYELIMDGTKFAAYVDGVHYSVGASKDKQ